MTPELADKIMTRIIARVEADGGVLHKSSGIEEIIATCAVAEAEGEVVDVISYDEAKGQWVHRDGKPLDMGDERAETVKGVVVASNKRTGDRTFLDIEALALNPKIFDWLVEEVKAWRRPQSGGRTSCRTGVKS